MELEIAIADPPRPRVVSPPPDLQLLVRQFGSYGQVTAEAWRAFDQQMRHWQNRHHTREGATEEVRP